MGFRPGVGRPALSVYACPHQYGSLVQFILQIKVPELNPSHVRTRHDENPLVKGTGGGGWYKTGHDYPWFLIVEVFLMAFFTVELGLRAVMADHDRSFWLSTASHCFFFLYDVVVPVAPDVPQG